MNASSNKVARLPLLDGLRGVAAICVMLYHVGNIFVVYTPFARSYLFVDFFFLLSGFVLTLSAEPKLNSGWTAVHFMQARFRRLWPVIAVGAIVGALRYGSVIGWESVPSLLLLALLMMPALHMGGGLFPLNGTHWSLFYELLANMLHALLLRRLRQRALFLLVVALGIAFAWTILAAGSNSQGPFVNHFLYALPRLTFSYSLGVLIARYWRQKSHRQIISWEIALVLPILILTLITQLSFDIAIVDATITLIGLPILFWLAATSKPANRAIPMLNWLGSISFPLYALHLPIIRFFAQIGDSNALKGAAILSSFLSAHLVAILIEGPLTRKRHGEQPLGEANAALHRKVA